MSVALLSARGWIAFEAFRRRARRIAAAAILGLGLGLSHQAAAAAEPLKIAVSMTPLSLPIFIADSEGYFAAEGVAVALEEVLGGHRTLQRLLEGGADLATSSEAVVMFNSFRSADYAVIATFVTSDDDVKVIVRPGSGILSAKDLRGKRVGTITAASAHFYLDTLLLLNGVDPKAVQIRGLQPETMAAALAKGDVDAVSVWEPYGYKVLAAVPGAKLLPKSGAYVETFNLIVHKKHRGARDADLARLLRALDRAQQLIAAEPLKAQAVLRSRLQLDQAFVEWIWPRFRYRLALEQSLLKTLEAEARWARQEGHVKAERSPNYLDYIHSGPLRQVRPSAVGIVE